MLNLAEINSAVQETFLRELKVTSDAIKENMRKNNQVATGATIDSIREDVVSNVGSIYGFDHIDTLETGISPERSKAVSWIELYRNLYNWYKAKGYTVTPEGATTTKRDRRVASAVTGQRMMGSQMWRNGITKNVYSQEVDPLVQRLSDKIGMLVTEIKILQ